MELSRDILNLELCKTESFVLFCQFQSFIFILHLLKLAAYL